MELDNRVKTLTGILCTFDTIERDMETRLPIACTAKDIQIIQTIHGDMHMFYIPNPEQP